MLFNKRLLQNSIDIFEFPSGDKAKVIENIINGWQKSFKNSDLNKAKETAL